MTHPNTPFNRFRRFLDSDASGGTLLILATVAALAFSNLGGLRELYDALLNTRISLLVGDNGLEKPLLLWINDGMMAVFFLMVGLELKRELLNGQLADRRHALLPLIAALGGILAPALIYAAFNFGNPAALQGWAIPAATDIAFALGILALLGDRVCVALKVFLLAVAIFDDLAAIIIIAVFFTSDLSTTALAVSAGGILALAALNRAHVVSLTPYVLVGAFVWVFLLKSGVHATLAGVVTAMFVPDRRHEGHSETLLDEAEHALRPWVYFFIVPMFAFANAGVALTNLSVSDLFGPISIGIALGLFLGKQAGIMAAVWIAVRFRIADLPPGVAWRHMHGAALLAGIGFTMSLFIGTLAFADPTQAAAVRVGVLSGSLLSGVAGFLVLNATLAPAGGAREETARA